MNSLKREHLLTALFMLVTTLGMHERLFAADRPDSKNAENVPRFLDDAVSHSVRLPTVSTNTLGWTIRVRVSSQSVADPMRVEWEFATTGGPTTADLNLELRLTPLENGHSPPQSSVRVSMPFSVPEGTSRMRFARHVPKTSYGDYYTVSLHEEGRDVPNCEATIGGPISDPDSAPYANQFAQDEWRMLWVTSKADEALRDDSLHMFSLIYDVPPFHYASAPEAWLTMDLGRLNGQSIYRFPTVKPADLPIDWRGLCCFDSVMIHRTDWTEITESPSAVASAMMDWVRAGGVLIIRDASAKDDADSKRANLWKPSSEIDAVAMSARNTAATFDRYAQPGDTSFDNDTRYLELEQREQWVEWFPQGAAKIRESLQRYPATAVSESNGVMARSELAGLVILLGNQDQGQPIEVMQWAAISDLMGWRSHRLIRTGVDPILGSQRFFQWVIPGVSQPPVYTFMGLLGVFVILVGPVAYRKTARAGRSYLMFAIAPLLAIATTGAMLGYGVIADGFSTQVRTRQITWVDGAAGDAVTRTRSTYFAGIRPAGGLAFPPDADVTLYPDNQDRSWQERTRERFESRGEVIVTDEEIRLNRDFLPSRQQRQFVMHRPARGWGRIRVAAVPSTDAPGSKAENQPEQATEQLPLRFSPDGKPLEPLDGPESIMVTSETQSQLDELLVCDEKKRYFFAEKLAPGATTSATQISKKEASERMGEMYKRQWLISSLTQRRENRNAWNTQYVEETRDLITDQLGMINSTVKPQEGVFEYELQQRMQLQSDLPANSFLAITELSAEADAIEGAEVVASIHYVFGSLP